MGEVRPLALFGFIDREKLDDLDKAVYDGTAEFLRICEPSGLVIASSDNYQVRYSGRLFSGTYFSFVGQQGRGMADILRPLQSDLLEVVEDAELIAIISKARGEGFHALVPTEWTQARQMNMGLYEDAAKFDIKPPCLRIGKWPEKEKFVEVARSLAQIEKSLSELRVRKRRGE